MASKSNAGAKSTGAKASPKTQGKKASKPAATKAAKPAKAAAGSSTTPAAGGAAPAAAATPTLSTASTPAAPATSQGVSASVPASTIQPQQSAQPAIKTGAKGKKQNKPQVGGQQAQQKQNEQGKGAKNPKAQKSGKTAAGAVAGTPAGAAVAAGAAAPGTQATPVAATAAANSFLVPTRVVIILRGRYAGRKAVIVKNYASDASTAKGSRKFSHLLVAGIDRYPLKVTKDMGKRKIAKRSRVRPFLKVINHQHVMPTRYGLDVPLSSVLKGDTLTDVSVRQTKEKEVKKAFQERYNTGKNRWFFTKLRF